MNRAQALLLGLDNASGAPTFPVIASAVSRWKASLSPLYQDSGRTTPAVADTDPVGSFSDLIGTNHLAQATTTKRPLLKLGLQSGKGALRFDGVDDLLQKAFSLNQPETIFAVINPNNLGATNFPIFIDNIANDGTGPALYQEGTFTARPDIAAPTQLSGTHAFSGATAFVCVFNNTTSQLVVNGLANTGTAGANNSGGLSVGGHGTEISGMDVYELAVYSTALVTADIDRLLAYAYAEYTLHGVLL